MYSSGFQSCFYDIIGCLNICFIYHSIENLKLYNLPMNRLFRFCLCEIAETVYCVPHNMNTHGYRHDQLGKVVRFSISVSQMKYLVESRPNPVKIIYTRMLHSKASVAYPLGFDQSECELAMTSTPFKESARNLYQYFVISIW